MNITRYIRWTLNTGSESQRLYWTIGAVAIALAPHLANLPLWIPLATGAATLWRVVIETRALHLPPRWLRFLVVVAATAGVALTFRTLNGLDAGTALLAMMTGVKMLETRGTRDYTMLIFIGYVLMFAALLYDQSLLRLPYILGASWLLTATLLRLHQTARPVRAGLALRTTGTMLLQALPIAVLLFLFFPRLPGQFWLLPSRNNAATGLSDEMAPGDISSLSLSGDTAFRVKFSSALPPPSQRYWRGPVLHSFDGRRWRRASGRIFNAQTISGAGPEYSYRITLEPTQRDWVFALDVPTIWPEGLIRLADLQLVSRRPISTLTSFNLQSHTRYRTPPELSLPAYTLDTALPGAANPRTRALAEELRAASRNDVDFVQAVLDKFRREQFFYTLSPPLLGANSVDEFLFGTRRGFCEHYASAFTVLMRAAKIPSRVVTGYQGGEYNTLGDYLLVKQSDAHAWSEVWLPNQGWVRIDPTAAVSPQRIERNLDAAIADDEAVPGRFLRNNFFFSRTRLTWDAVNNFWNNRIVEYDELKQRALLASVGVQNTDYRTLGIAVALSLLLFFTCLTVYLGWQYRPRKRDPIVTVYDELCRKLARVNLPRLAHEGSSDYLRRVATSQPALAAELSELRDLYASLRYGPDALNSELSRLKYLVNRLQPQAPARTTEMST